MSYITKTYKWLPSAADAVALDQSISVDVSLTLNGVLTNNGIADFGNIARNVLITFTVNSTAVFLITGTRNGQIINEALTLSNKKTVSSVNFFNTVTNIVASSGIFSSTVSVGTGLTGCTDPFTPNSFLTNSPMATAIHTTIDGGNGSYNVVGSIEPWNSISIASDNISSPTIFYLNEGVVNSTSGEYLTANPASASSLINVNDLPLTMISVVITETSNLTLKVRITSPRLAV